MKAILSADRKWGLGYQGRLLVSIPSDLRFFRETTMGHVVVMGRKTLESFSGGQPLKKRTNIVLTSDQNYKVKDAVVVNSVEALLEELRQYNDEDIYVIGGESIYRQLLPYCKVAHITKIDHAYEADTYFPNLDEMPEWKLVKESEEETYFDIEYQFLVYQK